LEEGAVKVYCEEKKGTEQKSLSPGEQAVIQSKTINTQTVQVQEYTSWANGIYEYTDTSLETIVQQLSRWYNVNMTFTDPQLRERKFAGVIFRDQPLQKAVDILSKVSNVHFRQKGNVIEITENRPQY
jgi:putative anti-sigma factor